MRLRLEAKIALQYKLILSYPVGSLEVGDGVVSDNGAMVVTNDIIHEIVTDEESLKLCMPLWEG